MVKKFDKLDHICWNYDGNIKYPVFSDSQCVIVISVTVCLFVLQAKKSVKKSKSDSTSKSSTAAGEKGSAKGKNQGKASGQRKSKKWTRHVAY